MRKQQINDSCSVYQRIDEHSVTTKYLQIRSVHLSPHRITGYKVSLATVHLDQDRKHNDFSNLASLCQWYHLKHDRSRHAYSRRYGNEVFYVNGYLFTLDAICPQIVPIKNLNAIPLSLFDHRLQSPVLVKTLFDDVAQIA